MSAPTPDLIVGYEYTTGYHGTDIVTARTIFRDGFRLDSYGTDFAPADNYELAKGHGNKNALRARMGEFAVIGVSFNQVGRIASEYGNIRFYEEELGRLLITHMDVYQLGATEEDAKLIETMTKSL